MTLRCLTLPRRLRCAEATAVRRADVDAAADGVDVHVAASDLQRQVGRRGAKADVAISDHQSVVLDAHGQAIAESGIDEHSG